MLRRITTSPTRDGPQYVPPTGDGPQYVPPTRDGPQYVPPTRDGPQYVPPTGDGPQYVPPTRDGPQYVPSLPVYGWCSLPISARQRWRLGRDQNSDCQSPASTADT